MRVGIMPGAEKITFFELSWEAEPAGYKTKVKHYEVTKVFQVDVKAVTTQVMDERALNLDGKYETKSCYARTIIPL